MTIVLTGGGSGGHITPLLAVAHELKIQQPDARLVYIGETGGRLADIVGSHEAIDASYRIFAGKLRRYHGEGFKQLLDLPTMLRNLRDGFLVAIGFCQSLYRLWRLKPAAIFCKGGFVSVPVGLAAALLRIPYITHDSDTIPGLANRIIARWASAHAVAMPKELYPYPQNKTHTVGVPLEASFRPVTADLQHQYRRELGIESAKQVVFVTGGGLGAVRLNNAVIHIAERLLSRFDSLYLLHATGRGQDGIVQAAYDRLPQQMRDRILVRDFVRDLYRYSGAADIIIARGGASALAEFAIQEKACVVVPNPLLTGGHQIKNAENLRARGAIVQVSEAELQTDPAALLAPVVSLLQHPDEAKKLAKGLAALAHPDAAAKLAVLLLNIVRKG